MSRLRLPPVSQITPQLLQTAFDQIEKWSRSFAAGTAVGTWPGGSPNAGIVTVTHGLGVVPVAVVATSQGGLPAAAAGVVQVFNYTATTFQFNITTADGSLPGAGTTQTIAWVAIG